MCQSAPSDRSVPLCSWQHCQGVGLTNFGDAGAKFDAFAVRTQVAFQGICSDEFEGSCQASTIHAPTKILKRLRRKQPRALLADLASQENLSAIWFGCYRWMSHHTVTAGCAAVWRRTLVIVVQARFATRITHKHGDDHRSRETCQMRGRRNDRAGRRMRQ
jgi:hypothetical protein